MEVTLYTIVTPIERGTLDCTLFYSMTENLSIDRPNGDDNNDNMIITTNQKTPRKRKPAPSRNEF